MAIQLNGTTGITTSGSLTTTGNIVSSGEIISLSDESLKENIEIIPDALDLVDLLDGVFYTYKGYGERRHTGLIAQRVEEVLPEVVYNTEMGTKAVAYGNVVGVLIQAIKELKKEVEELKNGVSNE